MSAGDEWTRKDDAVLVDELFDINLIRLVYQRTNDLDQEFTNSAGWLSALLIGEAYQP